MGYSDFSNSKSASDRLCLFAMSEPGYAHGEGVYLGRTSIYKIPLMLDLHATVNPHISILGMSGAGKSYMLKNLIIREVVYNSSNTLILDWNGEYSDTVRFLNGNDIVIGRGGSVPSSEDEGFAELLRGVNSINLHRLRDDEERKRVVYSAIRSLIEYMHGRGIGERMRLFVVLDEAWRMLDNPDMVQQLYREGRKYGISVVTATQAVGDVSRGVISNSACLFIFKLQGDSDVAWLVESGVVEKGNAALLGELPVGACMVRINYKGVGRASAFFLDRIDGFSTDLRYITKGDRMKYEISLSKMLEALDRLVVDRAAREGIRSFLESGNGRMELVNLVREMMRLGLDRATVVTFTRAIGVNDTDSVEAYENAKDVRLEIDEE